MRVPRFEPFVALRYAPSFALNEVTAPPYDVLDADDVERLRALHPRNIVHLDVPREQDGPGRYRAASDLLAAWRADHTLTLDPHASFTLYRMHFVDSAGRSRHTVGVLGAIEVVDDGAGGVLPHERTTPKATTDRLDLTRATATNLSPVWGLSLRAGLTGLLRDPGEPLGELVDEEGVVHVVERVTASDRVAAISAAVASAPVLIADGHHRYAISRTYRDEVRAAEGSGTLAELTLCYVAELVDDQLSIDAIHRLYHGIDPADLLEALSRSFDITPCGPVSSATAADLVERGVLCFVGPDGGGNWLSPRPTAFAGVRALDGAYLEHALADVRVDVTYQHGVDHVLHHVTSGAASAGVLIRPTSIDEIRRTAHEHVLMPPKSTFFTPKLRTGLVLRPMRDVG